MGFDREDDDGTWIVTGATPFAAAHAALTLADWLRWDEPWPRPFRKGRGPVFHSVTMEFDDSSGKRSGKRVRTIYLACWPFSATSKPIQCEPRLWNAPETMRGVVTRRLARESQTIW